MHVSEKMKLHLHNLMSSGTLMTPSLHRELSHYPIQGNTVNVEAAFDVTDHLVHFRPGYGENKAQVQSFASSRDLLSFEGSMSLRGRPAYTGFALRRHSILYHQLARLRRCQTLPF